MILFKPDINKMRSNGDLQGLIKVINDYAEKGEKGYDLACEAEDALIEAGGLQAVPLLGKLKRNCNLANTNVHGLIDNAMGVIVGRYYHGVPSDIVFEFPHMTEEKLYSLRRIVETAMDQAKYSAVLDDSVGSIKSGGFGWSLLDEGSSTMTTVLKIKCRTEDEDNYTLTVSRLQRNNKSDHVFAILLYTLPEAQKTL
jgi:hypothetical protein